MRITANHVTLLRLVFLPIPCTLLFGGPWHKAAALVLFVAIGLTDYLDGYLARKYGATTLGALIDPMADKIFVTAMFVPLARAEVVPLWMVFLIFVREFTVTELRSIHGSRGIHFQTSELAKYKTTIQMIGGAVIILNDIFRFRETVLIPLGGFLLFTLALAWRTYQRNGRVGLRIITLVTLVAWALGMRCVFSYTTANWAIMALVVGVTILSGLQYVLETWRHLGGYLRKEFGVAEWATFAGVCFAFPAIYLSALHSSGVASWTIIAILSVEFVTGGVNNLLATLKKSTNYVPPTAKTLLLNGVGLLALLLLVSPLPGRIHLANGLLSVALAMSLVFCLKVLYVNRHTLFGAPEVAT